MEFEASVPPHRRLYRGVASAEAAQASRSGSLGGGDYGRGIYLTRDAGQAVHYAQNAAGRGRGTVIRGAVDPDANVQAPPPRVMSGGSAAIDRWADENDVDVVDVGNYQIVRNPDVLTFDGRDYDLNEAMVLDYMNAGYDPEGDLPQDAIDRVRTALNLR